jgi:hypothetical protein
MIIGVQNSIHSSCSTHLQMWLIKVRTMLGHVSLWGELEHAIFDIAFADLSSFLQHTLQGSYLMFQTSYDCTMNPPIRRHG